MQVGQTARGIENEIGIHFFYGERHPGRIRWYGNLRDVPFICDKTNLT
jgi:hypothetical protein